jgi:hypothetical protein
MGFFMPIDNALTKNQGNGAQRSDDFRRAIPTS